MDLAKDMELETAIQNALKFKQIGDYDAMVVNLENALMIADENPEICNNEEFVLNIKKLEDAS